MLYHTDRPHGRLPVFGECAFMPLISQGLALRHECNSTFSLIRLRLQNEAF